ncbi:hypothetical protein BDW74DRAFT_188139 [Aspergillus multicolor]|uniref:uncharacterized protein n=1 Tax=Aspergillus multicolor TaxID=41759 RepID=UPI003CCDD17F
MSSSSKPKDAFRVAKPTKKLRAFATDLEAALQRCIPSKTTRHYEKASVLALHWEKDDLNVVPLEKALLDVFKSQYGYDVESYEIPEQNSQEELAEELLDWTREHKGEQALRIVVYSGHSSGAGPTDPHWYFGGRADSNGNLVGSQIDWLRLRQCCEYASDDLCYIFDCCSAGSDAFYDGPEILCASGFQQTAGADPKFSFTQAFIDTLEDLEGAPSSIANIFATLYRNSAKSNVAASPLHIAKKNAPSIVLQKLVIKTLSKTMTKTALGDKKGKKPATQKIHKVLVAVHIEDDKPDLAAWKQWLTQNIPDGVLSADVNIEAVFETSSSLLLVTLPLELWTMLDPTDTAFRFVSFVNSSGRAVGQSHQEAQPQFPICSPPGPRSSENVHPSHRHGKSLG